MEIRSGTARSGEIELYYEDMGDPHDPAVLLIMGVGAQLLLWRRAFCEKLVAHGLRVVRFDNRDVGLSSKTDSGDRRRGGAGRWGSPPSAGHHTGGPMIPRMVRFWLGIPNQALYTLEDMADDAAAVLDHLGIDRAHIVGASMGGMIAQVVAARFSERTRSLAVIFSSNNRPLLPPPAPRALLALLKGPPPGSPREVIIDNAVRVTRIIGSPAYPAPEPQIRAEAIEGYQRSYYPWGIPRHFGAILGSGSLVHYNRRTTAPTVVLHGRADKLMRPSGGRAIARAIDDARLVLLDGMGHELPEPLWDRVIGELTATFAQA